MSPYKNGIQYFGGIGNPTSLNEVYPMRGSVFGVGFDQSGGAASCPGQVYNHDIQSSSPHTTELHLRRIENSTGGNSSRENFFPWKAAGATVKTCLAPVSFSNQSHKEVFQSHLHSGNNGHLGLSHCRTRNHRYAGIDNRFYGICSSNIWGRRIGLNNAAAQRFYDRKPYMPQFFPGLRPRWNISKFVQARAHQTQLIKPTNFGSHRGVLIEQPLQPAPGQGGLPAVGFEPQKLQGRSANYACSDLPDDVSSSPILLFGTMNIGDNLLCNSRIAMPITQSHAPYRNDPFSDVVHRPLKHDGSADRAIDHANNSYDLDKKSGFVKGDKRNNVNAVLSCLSFSHCGKDTEEFDANSRSITMMPQSDITAKSDGIFKPVESLIIDNSVIYLSEIKGPLALPMHRLSSSSTEIHLSAPASSHSSNYVLEADDFVPSAITSLPRDETRLQLNNMHLMEENSCILEQLNENIAGDTSKDNIKDRYAISDENAVGSSLLWKS